MSKPAISVENLSKAYRIGLKEEIPDTLVGALSSVAKSPFKNFNRLRRLDTFSDHNQTDSDSEDTLWAIKDVSFDVQEGEVVGIIGRNGAGKSTLLKVLSRITEPTSGRVTIRGRVSSLLEVGTGFHPELTGRENIYMNGTILGMTKREIDRKFDEIVDFSGVEKFLDTPVKRYSSGMQVRLAFAVAAHLEPEILIIDEVLAVGDAEFQKKCLGKMRDVAENGRTVLFVSHNMIAVENLCRHGIEFSKGRIVFTGATTSVLSHYRSKAFSEAVSASDSVFKNSKHFKGVTLVDNNGNPTRIVSLGGKFELRLQIESKKTILNAKIGIGIDSSDGQRMLTVHTPNENSIIGDFQGSETFSCVIESFPLRPGDYLMKIALSDGMHECEALTDIMPFTVVDAKLRSEGRGFHRGICVADSHWTKA